MISTDVPGAVTMADREQTALALMFGCSAVVLSAVGLGNAPSGIRHGYAALIPSAVLLAQTWVCVRAWRIQLRIDERGGFVAMDAPSPAQWGPWAAGAQLTAGRRS